MAYDINDNQDMNEGTTYTLFGLKAFYFDFESIENRTFFEKNLFDYLGQHNTVTYDKLYKMAAKEADKDRDYDSHALYWLGWQEIFEWEQEQEQEYEQEQEQDKNRDDDGKLLSGLRLLEKAASAEHGRAYSDLGDFYSGMYRHLVPQYIIRPTRALQYYHMAIQLMEGARSYHNYDSGDTYLCLAMIYADSPIVSQNASKACEYLEKAMKRGSFDAIYLKALWLFHGRFFTQDPVHALALLRAHYKYLRAAFYDDEKRQKALFEELMEAIENSDHFSYSEWDALDKIDEIDETDEAINRFDVLVNSDKFPDYNNIGTSAPVNETGDQLDGDYYKIEASCKLLETIDNAIGDNTVMPDPQPDINRDEANVFKTDNGNNAVSRDMESARFQSDEAEYSAWDKLDALVGLAAVKQQLTAIEKRVLLEKRRAAHNLASAEMSNHFAFKGNPGTGKSEVARILGQLFYENDLLRREHIIEVERHDLIGTYMGHTPVKTLNKVKEALGGVLFIDEAHDLCTDARDYYGHEAVSTLVKAMEDHRNNLVVVLAGYKDEMDELLHSNTGLMSRIRHHIEFENYTARELTAIFKKMAHDAQYILDEDAEPALVQLMQKAVKHLNPKCGNGRFARHVLEKTCENMAIRVINHNLDSKQALQTIRFVDIPRFETVNGKKNPRPNRNDNDTLVPFTRRDDDDDGPDT